MVDITVMDEATHTSHKPSTAFLGMVAQACAFMAAPLLTASVGLGVAKMFGVGAAVGSAAASIPLLVGLFALGAVFAGASIVTNYAINKIKQAEAKHGIEQKVERVLEKNHPELTMNQGVAVHVECVQPENAKSWVEQLNESRANLAKSAQR